MGASTGNGRALRPLLAAVVAAGAPGALALSRGGGTSIGDAVGHDVRTAEPLMVASPVAVGSVTKTVVATIVLQLVAEGRLGLDDAVGDLLPQAQAEEATARQLLNHTSGLDDETGAARGAWAYSNRNYVDLGRLVEAVTGRSAADELADRVLRPLALTSTQVPPDRSHAWTAGGLESNAGDVARFLEALLSGHLLPPPLLAEMLAGVESPWPESDRYGLGICEIGSIMGVVASPGRPAWGHVGLHPEWTTVALSTPDGRRQAVVAVNKLLSCEVIWRAVGELTWAALYP